MRIGDIEARRGEKAFGFLKGAETHGRFVVELPLHVVEGERDGPVLLVQAGVAGQEIEPAMILPRVVDELRPADLRGTLLVVPLLNVSGFEFEQKNAIWDGKDLHALGRGRQDGTVSEQLIWNYYEQVVSKADALIDFRTGALWGYFRYAGVYEIGSHERSCQLAAALGLPHVVVNQPADESLTYEAARDGKAVTTAWIGGGPGLRDYREEDMSRTRNAVLNALRHLGMRDGPQESLDGEATLLRAHTIVKPSDPRGLTFMDKTKRGLNVQKGETIGFVKHPFTGEVMQQIAAPRSGIVVHGGAAWPIVPEDAPLAILADRE